MSTSVRIDLRGAPPYYTITSRGRDRVVRGDSGGVVSSRPDFGNSVAAERASVLSSLAAERSGVLGDLAAERESILAGTSGASTRASLAAERSQILANTSGASVRASLANERNKIFTDIRGDNCGPTMVRRYIYPDYGTANAIAAQANLATTPQVRRELEQIVALERTYAEAAAAAQQVVQDAVMDGADWAISDSRHEMAKAKRQAMLTEAVRAYNIGLPAGYYWQLRKTVGV